MFVCRCVVCLRVCEFASVCDVSHIGPISIILVACGLWPWLVAVCGLIVHARHLCGVRLGSKSHKMAWP